MKNLLLLSILFLSVNAYGITGFTYPWIIKANDTVTYTKWKGNNDIVKTWADRACDTINRNVVHYKPSSTQRDSSIKYVKIDTVANNTIFTGTTKHDSIVVTKGMSSSNINTGNGACEVYPMNQNLRTTDTVSFNKVNTPLVVADTSRGTVSNFKYNRNVVPLRGWSSYDSAGHVDYYSCGATNGSSAPGWSKLISWVPSTYTKRYAKFLASSRARSLYSGVLTVNFRQESYVNALITSNVTWEPDNYYYAVNPSNFILLYNSTSNMIELWYNDLFTNNSQSVFFLVKESSAGVTEGMATLYYGASGSLPAYTSGATGVYADKQFNIVNSLRDSTTTLVASDSVKVHRLVADTLWLNNKWMPYDTGSFACTLKTEDVTVQQTNIVHYSVIGENVTLSLPEIYGTSNSTNLSLYCQIPIIAKPKKNIYGTVVLGDNGGQMVGIWNFLVSPDNNKFSFKKYNNGIFTASGIKGFFDLNNSCFVLTYTK